MPIVHYSWIESFMMTTFLMVEEYMPGNDPGFNRLTGIAELYRGSLELGGSSLGDLLAHINLPAVKPVH